MINKKVWGRKMSEWIEEIAKEEDLKNVCKKCLRSFHILRGLNHINIWTCSKLKEEPKEPPDPSGLEDKDSSLHLCCTWGRY